MVCILGPSDSMQELDLTGENKKITREVFAKFWSEKYGFNWYKGISWNKQPKIPNLQTF